MKTATSNNVRLIDKYFDEYDESYQNHGNRLIYWICVPLSVFSLLGLVWSIPFPHLKILGSFNGMFNWASFLIAFAVYYYYKLSPVLSYFMLIIIMLFCYLITLLISWREAGGAYLWQSCLFIFVVSWLAQIITHKITGKKTSFFDEVKFLLIGPIRLLHFMLRHFRLKY